MLVNGDRLDQQYFRHRHAHFSALCDRPGLIGEGRAALMANANYHSAALARMHDV
jgi:hypothetical protein